MKSRSLGKGTVGWYIERIADPTQSAQVAAAIDALFTNSSAETKTGSEKAFVQGFAKQTGDIGAIVTAIGIAVFFTMLLVSANTMAQSVRERTNEVAVLKTLGFTDPAVLALVIGESLLLTIVGGVIGIAGAMLAVGRLGSALSEYLSAFLLTPQALLVGVVLMIGLGVVAGRCRRCARRGCASSTDWRDVSESGITMKIITPDHRRLRHEPARTAAARDPVAGLGHRYRRRRAHPGRAAVDQRGIPAHPGAFGLRSCGDRAARQLPAKN